MGSPAQTRLSQQSIKTTGQPPLSEREPAGYYSASAYRAAQCRTDSTPTPDNQINRCHHTFMRQLHLDQEWNQQGFVAMPIRLPHLDYQGGHGSPQKPGCLVLIPVWPEIAGTKGNYPMCMHTRRSHPKSAPTSQVTKETLHSPMPAPTNLPKLPIHSPHRGRFYTSPLFQY